MMSRGMGKIEISILQAMQTRPDQTYWTRALCIHAYAPDKYDPDGGDYDWRVEFTQAQRKAVLRAAASLERKGYIKSHKRIRQGLNYGGKRYRCRGGTSWEKEYVLIPVQNWTGINT
jgi:hypothetical protein